MNHYARRLQAPTALTPDEQSAVLDLVGAQRAAERDHALLLLALRTGLREHELAALDVADVLEPTPRGRGRGRSVRRRLRLRVFKGASRARGRRRRRREVVIVPDDVRRVLERYMRGKNGPLFVSRLGRRLSTRQIRHLWRAWQLAAGLDPHPFHALRHTYVTNLVAAGASPFVVQRLARHARLETTQRYAHPSDAEIEATANLAARPPRPRRLR